MKPFLDQNVLLDGFLDRSPWNVDAKRILAASASGLIRPLIAPHTLSTIFYIVRKDVNKAAAYDAVDTCIDLFEIVPLLNPTAKSARGMSGSDFEDCLQLACAIGANVDTIVTRNTRDFTNPTIRVETPAQFVTRLALP